MLKHNLQITIRAKDQKTIDTIFNHISNNNGIFFGEGSFINSSTWECKRIIPTYKKLKQANIKETK